MYNHPFFRALIYFFFAHPLLPSRYLRIALILLRPHYNRRIIISRLAVRYKKQTNSRIAADETAKLVLELQTIARQAGHQLPLLIGLDQENGGVNSLFDDTYIRQFPSAMGVAATGSTKLAREVAKATAQELRAVGVNWILGPVLDVLTDGKNQPLGVRSCLLYTSPSPRD